MDFKDYTGEIVKATVDSIHGGRIFFKLDETQMGCLPMEEAPDAHAGDSVEVYIEGMAKNGIWMGSREMIQAASLFEKIHKAQKDKSDLQATVVAAQPNGLVCNLLSLMAFMPRREIEESPLEDLELYVKKQMTVRILKFSAADGNIIISHRAAVAQQIRESRENLLAQLKPDQIYRGTVKKIADFGAFVDIGYGVEGLVHRSNLSWDNADPASLTATGEKIDVKILSLENGKISLGHKQLIPDTWAETIKDLKVDDLVDAHVTTFANFGAYARLDGKNLEGLIHNSEVSWNSSVRNARQILKLNDAVKVRIIGIDNEKRRLKLSLKRAQENPWIAVAEKYPVGETVKVKVSGIAEFGLFVDLGQDIRGLIHRNDIQWSGPVFDLDEKYHVGDEIECKVLAIDTEKERASLGIKQLTRDPWQEFVSQKPLGRAFEAKIQRIAKFGAFATIAPFEVDGLIHISELSENRVESVESVVKVDQVVTVTVISIDDDKHRVGLSLTAEPFDPEPEAENAQSEEASSHATLADILPDQLKS